jgi:cathepsin L
LSPRALSSLGRITALSLEAVFHAKWQAFKAKHGKEYEHHHHEEHGKRNFLEHTHHIESHNEKFHKGEADFALSHNTFSDISHAKFKSTKLGFRAPPAHLRPNGTKYIQHRLGAGKIPVSVDWRKPCPTCQERVKNQGECGSCYTFATTGALECALMRKTNRDADLSEQNLVDCSRGEVNNGCDGGLMTESFEYIKRAGGINAQQDYPYRGDVGQCRYNPSKKAGHVNSYVEIPNGNENALTHALATVGSIAVALDAGPREFMMYSRGVFSSTKCSPENLSHAVLAVGYGTENGKDYYLIRNSWGTDWGEKGYFRIARNAGNMCGIAEMASYPIV